MKFHCLFEQSGTFKNVFKDLGFEAFDYDIRDDFSETDYKLDLFDEIKNAYEGRHSVLFDELIEKGDMLLAFFPCTRFESQISLAFQGKSYQMKDWSDMRKLAYVLNLHEELHEYYTVFCKLFMLAYVYDVKLVVENPCSQPHYLTRYFPLVPAILDWDRQLNGDFFKKPTQYWFVNCQPCCGLHFEQLNPKKGLTITGYNGHARAVARSCISPDYARYFIKTFILENEEKEVI